MSSHGKQKGSEFERGIARQLSTWWTGGVRDDVFYRSAGSGAWTTNRFKRGKATSTQQGDIQALDSVGDPLTNLCAIELKIGYSAENWEMMELIDRVPRSAPTLIEKFIRQSIEQSAGKFPVLIARRDRRKAVILFPQRVYHRMTIFHSTPHSMDVITLHISKEKETFAAMNLDQFLAWCSPEFFKDLYAKQKE